MNSEAYERNLNAFHVNHRGAIQRHMVKSTVDEGSYNVHTTPGHA